MAVRLNPYLSFRDNAREAMAFYHSVFGGELTVSTFADFDASADPTEQHRVMHSQLDTPDVTLTTACVSGIPGACASPGRSLPAASASRTSGESS
jgi:PhnB protein